MNLNLRGDTSTDSVLNGIQQHDKMILKCKYVSTNHFDVDSFLSVWSLINFKESLNYEIILRESARIGDFRELRLDYRYQYEALFITCWLNTIEKLLFYRPFESMITMSDGEMNSKQKFDYFLINFKSILINPCCYNVKSQCHDEYERVLKGYQVVNHSTIIIPLPLQYHIQHKQQQHQTSLLVPFSTVAPTSVSSSSPVASSEPSSLEPTSLEPTSSEPSSCRLSYDDKYLHHTLSYIKSIGLVIVRTPEPIHYYSLFSISRSYDMILSIYSNHRYEVELKYTTMVDIHSRPTLPRVDMHYLVNYLNTLENNKNRNIYYSNSNSNYDVYDIVNANRDDGNCCNGDNNEGQYVWHADSITDSGPILRLERYVDNVDNIDDDNNNISAIGNSVIKNNVEHNYSNHNNKTIKNHNKHKKRLSKAERYAHPYERQIYPSTIPNIEFEHVILSYFTYAYHQDSIDSNVNMSMNMIMMKPKRDWSWNDIHQFNKLINWKKWNPHLIYL